MAVQSVTVDLTLDPGLSLVAGVALGIEPHDLGIGQRPVRQPEVRWLRRSDG